MATSSPNGKLNTQVSPDFYAALKKVVSGSVRTDDITRHIYSTDASMYQVMPKAVVFPKHTEDLQAVVELANQYGAAVLPRGGGTSLAGQCVNDAVVVDCSTYMNVISEPNLDEKWVWVQPGVVQDQLNAYLGKFGYAFGPDTSTSNRATIGGMAGNNSCGARSVIHGKTVDHVLEVKALLSDGTQTLFSHLDDAALAKKMQGNGLENRIYQEMAAIASQSESVVQDKFPKIMRRVSGYNIDRLQGKDGFNLAEILVGSEGTLAISTALKVKMVPLPTHKAVLVAQFKDMIEAVEADNLILSHKPAAMELIDEIIIKEAQISPAFAGKTGFLQGNPGAIVIVELYGESDAELKDRLEKLEADLKRNKMGYAYVRAMKSEDQAEVWNLRKGGLGLLMGRRISAKPLPFVEDTAVDPSKLAEYLKEFEQVIKKYGAEAGYYGHSSVGCLHVRPFIDLKEAGGKEKLMGIFNDVADLVQKYGGSMSAEHGDGRARSWLIKKLFGEELYQQFKRVKTAFDPENYLNPGNIVDAQSDPMENLRWGKDFPNPLKPRQNFDRDGGFHFALEMCNGNGHCRKLDVGTMCPSYQATRNDMHSTRGRANALKGVLQGDLPEEMLTSPEMYEVMDLCLECKACQTECPSKVNMAKFKYEFLYHYHKAHGVPLRDRLFSNIATLSKMGTRMAGLSNLLGRSGLGKQLFGLVGIAPERDLPAFSSVTFSSWFNQHVQQMTSKQPNGTNGEHSHEVRLLGDDDPQVVLFHDTFMEYNEPWLGQNTVHVLNQCGYRVVLVDKVCCGRPIISKGLLDKGQKHVDHNLAVLKPYAEKGIPIIGVEPSCTLTIKEDYRDLQPGTDADLVSKHTHTIDEFLAQCVEQGKLTFPTNGKAHEFLLHGHCHQRALIGTSPTVKVLQSMGGTVKESGAGCCGMAGSFGYEKEHYDISMKIAEDRLFPAVRSSLSSTEIVADGMSCRHQIAHGTNRQPRHLVQVVAEALQT